MATTYSSYIHHDAFDVEKGAVLNSFAERTVRQGFISKVFGLLAVQLALTTVVGGGVMFSPNVKAFTLGNPWLMFLSLVTSFGTILTFTFSKSARQQHPLNLLLLFTFTTAEGVLVGAASSQVRFEAVLLAFGLTAGITTAMALWALTTKEDLTTRGTALYSCLLGLVFAGLVGFFVRTSFFNVAVSGLGAVLFSIFIAYDVQCLLGGEHKYAVSPDDYVLGAISIYLDIINVFMHIMRMLSSRD